MWEETFQRTARRYIREVRNLDVNVYINFRLHIINLAVCHDLCSTGRVTY
jgi:hypothetical protein